MRRNAVNGVDSGAAWPGHWFPLEGREGHAQSVIIVFDALHVDIEASPLRFDGVVR